MCLMSLTKFLFLFDCSQNLISKSLLRWIQKSVWRYFNSIRSPMHLYYSNMLVLFHSHRFPIRFSPTQFAYASMFNRCFDFYIWTRVFVCNFFRSIKCACIGFGILILLIFRFRWAEIQFVWLNGEFGVTQYF